MKNNIIRWGVIGSGGIARRRTIPEGILPAANARLVSVYDIDTAINLDVAKEFDIHAVSTMEELLVSDIDAVYIATPVHLHLDQVIRSAKAGKHILCEKPLGLTHAEASQMGKACRYNQVLLGTAFMMRFSAQHQMALRMIERGDIGQPLFGRAQLSCWYPPIVGAWRQEHSKSGGGSLMDMGSHCIDLLEMFFGKVKKVNCLIRNNVHLYHPEDSALVSLEFEGGAFGSVDSFFCIPDDSSENRLEIYGSKGSILASGTIGQEISGTMIAYLNEETTGYNARQARSRSEGIPITPTPINTYQAEIEEFSAAILEKRKPLNNFERGLHSQMVMEACYQSAQSGMTIELNQSNA